MNRNAETLRTFFNQHSNAVTHIAVAHTNFRPYNCTETQIDGMVKDAQKQVRFFRRCFNQFMYGSKAHRKPMQYQPLLLTTMEGATATASKAQTIHFNFSMGNIPECLSTADLRAVFEHCWVEKAQLSGRELWLTQATRQGTSGWHSYITKEAERGTIATWDFENTQIPFVALANGQRT